MTVYTIRLKHLDTKEVRVILIDADSPMTAMAQALNENFQQDNAWRRAMAAVVDAPEEAES